MFVVFSFNTLHMASHTLVACMVSEKSDIILQSLSEYVCLLDFLDVSFIFDFSVV